MVPEKKVITARMNDKPKRQKDSAQKESNDVSFLVSLSDLIEVTKTEEDANRFFLER